MQVEKNQPQVTLIYHNFRGMAHPIRLVLCYLGINYKEILLNKGECLFSKYPALRQKFQDQVQLPCLIDGQYIIHNSFAIIRHLCAKTHREDLLGQTLEVKTLIREIYYNYAPKKMKAIQFLFKFGQKITTSPQTTEDIKKSAMLKYQQLSGAIVQMTLLKLKNQCKKYIFNHITVLDFLFYEESFYHINIFGNLQEKNCSFFQTLNSILGTDLQNKKQQSTIYLRIMRQFKYTFQNEPFYKQNQQNLESYSIVCPGMSQQTKLGLKNIWIGPMCYLNQ